MLLSDAGGSPHFPDCFSLSLSEEPIYIGRHGGRRFYTLLLPSDGEGAGQAAEKNVGAAGTLPGSGAAGAVLDVGSERWVNRRSSFRELQGEEFWISARAYQIARWDRESRFCGRCGGRQVTAAKELAKECPICGHREYPRIAPAMIVAVVSRGRLLMAHANKHREGLYSVLAGFVEPGESLEGCVAREIMEEAGIEVGAIRYFSSQSWPFPYSLMIAFTAEAASEEITIEPEEIGEAGWFRPEEITELPMIPPRMSVSRSLIDWFVDSYGDETTRSVHHSRE